MSSGGAWGRKGAGSAAWRLRVLGMVGGVEARALAGTYDVTVFKVVHVGGAAAA